jgi:ferredoxin-nitrite reductase
VEKAGLEWRASSIRAGLIACTGSRGCRFSAADTKTHAEDIADWCEARVTLDQPVNIHLTGCHHSCAQHYIGDIGLVAARVSVNEEGATDAPARVERLLNAYLSHRTGATESFQDFSARHEVAALKSFAEGQEA